MSSHTPGPWRYVPHHFVDNNYMLIHCSADPNEGDNLRGYCGLANARLIAAAPELLEAAKLVAAWYAAEEDHTHTDFYQRLQMCRDSEHAIKSAIAKATGETP